MAIEVPSDSALILIDVQKAWDSSKWGKRNNPDAESVINRLLTFWRKQDLHVIHVRHDSMNPDSPLRTGKPGFEYKDEARPIAGEIEIVKHVNSAFIGTKLEALLREMHLVNVFICGITTDHCVSTTARMSGNLGFSTYVISDACATYSRMDEKGEEIPAETVHRVNLASINGEFCRVIRSVDIFLP